MQQTVNEKSYDSIRKMLVDGKLKPGDKLVTRTLAEKIGVSLSPVREAINRLATEGLLEQVPGAVAEVKQLSIEELHDLYVLRDAIESCAAGLAAERATEVDWEELEFLIDQQSALADSIASSGQASATRQQMAKWIKLEEHFHETIIRCSRNELLAKVIREHRTIGRLFESHLEDSISLTTETARQTVQGKRDLLKTFRDREPEKASSMISQQIKMGRRNVIGQLRMKRAK